MEFTFQRISTKKVSLFLNVLIYYFFFWKKKTTNFCNKKKDWEEQVEKIIDLYNEYGHKMIDILN